MQRCNGRDMIISHRDDAVPLAFSFWNVTSQLS